MPQLQLAHAAFLVPQFLFDLMLYGQTMAIPTWDVSAVITHCLP